jgi:hypothetical protein
MVFMVTSNSDCESYTIWLGESKVSVCASYLEDEMRELLIRNGTITKYTPVSFKWVNEL